MAEKSFKAEMKDAWRNPPTKKDMRNGYILLGVIAAIVALWWFGKGPEKDLVPEAHQNVIKHVANSVVAAEMCTGFHANQILAAATMQMYGVKMAWLKDESRYQKLWQKRLDENKKTIQQNGLDNYCAAAWMLYGKSGINVPGLLVKN